MKRIFLHRLAVKAAAFAATALFIAIAGISYRAVAQGRELSLADILIALRSKKAVIEEKNKLLTDAVRERGITFTLTTEIEKELGNTGAHQLLIAAIREKNPQPRSEPKPEAVASLPKPNVQPAEPAAKPSPAPPDFAFYRLRATQALSSNDLDAAMSDLDKATELKPSDATAYADRGVIYMRREKHDSAIEQLTRAIELDPKDSVSYFNRGMVRERLGRLNDALADFEKAAAINPADEPANAAVARLKKAQSEAAAAASPKAPPVEPKSADPPVTIPLVVNVGALNAYATRLTVPIYPALERRMGIQGIVTVLIALDVEGNITSVKPVDGPKSLRPSAEYAVRHSKFKPVIRDGKPVAVSGSIAFKFVL